MKSPNKSISSKSSKKTPKKFKPILPKQDELKKLILSGDRSGLEEAFREYLPMMGLFEDRRKKGEGIFIVDQRSFEELGRRMHYCNLATNQENARFTYGKAFAFISSQRQLTTS